MSKRNPAAQRLLEQKFRALVDCVLAKASSDAEFGMELAEILDGETHADQPEPKLTGGRDKRVFNPVLFLKEHGDAALKRELDTRTDDDLRAILRAQGLRRGKELKRLPRTDMLHEIASGALVQLKQGMIVAGRPAREPAQQAVAADEARPVPPSDEAPGGTGVPDSGLIGGLSS